MIIGQFLFSDVNGASVTYYSPWFPAATNGAQFGVEFLTSSSGAKITISVETKDIEDQNSAANNVKTFDPYVTPDGTYALLCGQNLAGSNVNSSSQGFQQLVRFTYTVEDDSSSSLQWLNFGMLEPEWIGG